MPRGDTRFHPPAGGWLKDTIESAAPSMHVAMESPLRLLT